MSKLNLAFLFAMVLFVSACISTPRHVTSISLCWDVMVSRINPNKYEVMLRKTTIRSFANGQQEMYKLNAIWKDPQGKKLSDSAVNDLGIDSIMNGNMNCSVIKTVTTDYLVKNKWTLLSPDFGDCGCTSSDRRNTIDYNNIKRANKGLCCECNCRIITRDKKEYITGVIKEVLDDSIVNRIPFDVMIRTNKWLEIDCRKIWEALGSEYQEKVNGKFSD